MRNINIDDVVLIGDQHLVKVLVTRVNRTTFEGLDSQNNLNTYFIKEISKVFSKQKRLPLIFEEKISFSQPSLF